MGLVRYYLAFAVVVAHFNTVFGTDYYFPTSSYNAVGGFFALSGFLVYGSYSRSMNIKNYLTNRARRIFPPYFFIVLLAAFGLCGLSSLSVSDYFINAEWIKYLAANLTFINFIEPELPGVFKDNVTQAVNGSLWTMKIEIMLYLSVPVVVALSIWLHKKFNNYRQIWLFAAIYLCSMIYRIIFYKLYIMHEAEIYNILSRQVFGQLMYFYSGVFIYFNYYFFKNNKWIVLSVTFLLMLICQNMPLYQFIISPLIVSVITVCLSLIGDIVRVFNNNNVSYDVYLCHFPVMQVLFVLLGKSSISSGLLFIITLISIFILANISWFCIGKKFMIIKNRQFCKNIG